jgi:hypothetical protein|tara:strand:- start:155 stop:418 length:264 start_codon:yes stop_codon:yes gene_type:complete
MGAKFTIVLDTDDPQGLRDALEIATLLNKNHGTFGGNPAFKARIGKIALIKMIRDVAKLVESGKMDSSLRDSKRFIDGKWELLIHNS